MASSWKREFRRTLKRNGFASFFRIKIKDFYSLCNVKGANILIRKAASAMKPVIILSNNNGVWTHVFKVPIRSVESKFRDNEPYFSGVLKFFKLKYLIY